MDFEQNFPLRYYINLGYREDRRTELEWHLDEVGVSATRFPAIDARFCRNRRGFNQTSHYAQVLTHRVAIRRAKQQKQPAVLLLEDDVVFHPNFLVLIKRIKLPADCGIFHLGCQHSQRPKLEEEGLVKVRQARDTHAWAVHERYYDKVLAALNAFSSIPPTAGQSG